MMPFDICVMVLAGLMIVLGFIALLMQKTYLDANSGQTAVSVPLAGKMTTNVPALVFVFLGFALAFYEIKRSSNSIGKEETWTIKGSFDAPQHTNFLWGQGVVELVPSKTVVKLSDRGVFQITTEVESGKSIEQVIDALDYTHQEASLDINLPNEIKSYEAHQTNSLVQSLDRGTRTIIFKPAGLTFYNQ